MKEVNQERVNRLIEGIAGFGKSEKGITRLAYSKEDFAAQKWLLEQIADLKLTVTQDAIGNTFLRREGKNSQLEPVAMGSHLDTVAQGGAYDGVLGVVGALEVLYMLQNEELERPVEVIIFRAEESTRFGFATIGSKIMAGVGSPEKFSSAAKKNEASFEECLKENGYNPEDYAKAVKQEGCFKCFLELHIEQGKVLDETGEQIGIVKNIAAPTRFKIIVEGIADHSGATPMDFRRDALVAGAKLILAVQEAASEESENGTVATVGVVETEPGSINVIPGKVTLWVDLRGVDSESIQNAMESINEAVSFVAEEDSVRITVDMLTSDEPVPLSEDLANIFEEICQEKEISYRVMNSGAGHDAMHMAKLVPTSMVFIPCKDGISHNPDEYASPQNIAVGIEVLAAAVMHLANE
ncbi:MAG: Zn-dependent hydrolase [Acholeplasmataceae bacterium]|jgi:N-carbamoyl-L-amino-acid hydrolase|nr:Zn-dependent hydrolase [Acholeplasmataceae bacterium]